MAELKLIHDDICAAQAKATIVQTKPGLRINPGEMAEVLSVQSANTPIPDRLRVLIGEAANSFRAALNYLVTQLAVLDSGPGKRRNQFPIEDTQSKFKQSGRTFLKGVSLPHVAHIETLQPYKGCDWTSALARLSNFDKHDDLILVAHDYMVTVTLGQATEDSTGPNTLIRPMTVNLEPVLQIALGDRLPVVQTLESIQSQVSQTLDAFKPEFK